LRRERRKEPVVRLGGRPVIRGDVAAGRRRVTPQLRADVVRRACEQPRPVAVRAVHLLEAPRLTVADDELPPHDPARLRRAAHHASSLRGRRNRRRTSPIANTTSPILTATARKPASMPTSPITIFSTSRPMKARMPPVAIFAARLMGVPPCKRVEAADGCTYAGRWRKDSGAGRVPGLKAACSLGSDGPRDCVTSAASSLTSPCDSAGAANAPVAD